MDINKEYRTITREQFLFHEMRIVARLLDDGMDEEKVKEEVVANNLFQYPTERMIKNIASVCLNRFKETDSLELIHIVEQNLQMLPSRHVYF